MSISQFISAMGEDSIYTALPVPYIESVEVYDNKIDIMMSMYIPVQKQDYAFDQGAEYLTTYNDIAICVMALFDRNSNTTACGLAPENTSDEFTNLSTSAWTNYTQNKVSPIRYFYGEDPIDFPTSDAEFTEIVTNFVFDPDAADLEAVYAILTSSKADLFADYLLPPDSEGIRESADYSKILEYVENSVKLAGVWDESDTTLSTTTLNAVIIDLINQVIVNNDYKLIIELFGHVTYPAENFPVPRTADGLIPNMQLVKVHAKTIPVSKHFTDFAANITDVLEREDGSAILKLSGKYTLEGEQFSPAIYGRESRIGVKNMGFVAFTAPWFNVRERQIETVHHEIRDTVMSKSSEIVYWENSISETNHILVVTNDNIARDPSVAYMDANNKVYQEAMRSIDGTYYDSADTPIDRIVSSMSTAVTDAPVSSDTTLSFDYALSEGVRDPTDVLPILNKYRKAFPDKSTTTPEGQFYNAFVEVLYNTNTALKRATPLTKVLLTNPIVKDFRTQLLGSANRGSHVGEDYKQTYYELFSLDNALWSRYTEVTGHDPEEADITRDDSTTQGMVAVKAGDESYTYDTYSRTGGQWNYNFIDHGFMFFNYEKALKNTSFASRYLNITTYEKYFGAGAINSLFKMEECYLKAYWGDPDDGSPVMGSDGISRNIKDIVYSIGTMVLEMPDLTRTWARQDTMFHNVNAITVGGNTDGNMNLDKFDITVNNSIRNVHGGTTEAEGLMTDGATAFAPIKLTNEFGGADAMVKENEYSFMALRGFSPITVQEGVDPFHVDDTFFDENPLNYRLACIEFQKCDAFDASEGSNSVSIINDLAEEVDESSRGGAFRAAMLVKDSTHQLILDMQLQLENTLAMFEQYRAAANDKCSFNEGTGFFNQFFIDTITANWPDSADAPYFKSIVELVIFEDIFYSSYEGSTEAILEEIKVLTHSVSPNTGTVSGIENVATRFDFIRDTIDEIVTDYGEELIVAGHIYGHAPSYNEDYSIIETLFSVNALDTAAKIRAGTTETGSGMEDTYDYNCFTPDAGYDNYPLYPIDLVTTMSNYTIPPEKTPDPEVLEDLTEGLNTIVEGLIEGYELRNSITSAVVDAFLDSMAEIESRLGFDSWRGHTIDAIDILENLFGTIGSTFPPIDDLHGYTDAYGNSGYNAALDIMYMVENHAAVAGVIGDMMDFLNGSSASDLQSLVPSGIASMFEAGAYNASATASDYLASNSSGLQNILSLQVSMNMVSSAGSMSYMGGAFNNFNWL